MPEGAAAEEKRGEITGAERVSCDTQRGKTILLVDDDRNSLERLKVLLERRGYGVIAESDARTALALMHSKAQPIHLVITDYRMPSMDGLEFSCALKSTSPDTPLILITAYSDIESYLKAVNIGVLEYINKPVIANELLRIVGAALDRCADGAAPTNLSDTRA